MERSESIVELLAALCQARLGFATIKRNREGFSKRGGQTYQYADLNAIIDATAGPLAVHGLDLMQFLEDGADEQHVIVRSILYHASGEWISSVLTVLRDNDPQNFGITTTYAKRYIQQAMLNISTEDDPDGVLSKSGSETASRKPAAEPRGRTRLAEPTPIPDSPRPGKPAPAEVNALLQLMREAYASDGLVDEEVREVMKIPAPQPWNDARLRLKMTWTEYETLHRDAVGYIKEHITDGLDAPADSPGEPVGESSVAEVSEDVPTPEVSSTDEQDVSMIGLRDAYMSAIETAVTEAYDRSPVDASSSLEAPRPLPDETHESPTRKGEVRLPKASKLQDPLTKEMWAKVVTRAMELDLSGRRIAVMKTGDYDAALAELDELEATKRKREHADA